ncbi:unnamed protein product [Gongylonema pulchrum]|uniref:Adenylate kinase n=1 Tax=Gongylonema pulchrum TaxID=637853 RepID=A0A183CYD7_9BILA|nr:unnamed protein product [Gongylonema pulchrum]
MSFEFQMGCAPSTRFGRKIGDQIETPRIKESPRLPVHIGGPGSQKGLLLEELVNRFGFATISTEEIVFAYLPSKISETVENTADVQRLLMNDHSILAVEWVLSMMAAQISSSSNERFIIDIIPALNSILKCEAFNQISHDRHLAIFEEIHPVLCAVEINVTDEWSLLTNAMGGVKRRNRSDSTESGLNIQGVDEADKGRLEKRLDAYHKCSSTFISYFRHLGRVIRIDTSSKTTAKKATATIREVFLDLGFEECIRPTRAILFSYSLFLKILIAENFHKTCLNRANRKRLQSIHERQLCEIDFELYKIKRIRLSELTSNNPRSFVGPSIKFNEQKPVCLSRHA